MVLVLKQNRITAIASENNLPLIALVQSVSRDTRNGSFLHLTVCIIGRGLPTTTISSLPQGRPDIPRPCASIQKWTVELRCGVRLFHSGRGLSSSIVRLHNIRQRSSPSLSGRTSSGKNGNGRDCRGGRIGRRRHAFHHHRLVRPTCNR